MVQVGKGGGCGVLVEGEWGGDEMVAVGRGVRGERGSHGMSRVCD